MDRFTFTATGSLTESPPATVRLLVGAGGTGLKGYDYDNKDFTVLKATQLDPVVNFDWGSASPAKTLGTGTCGVRWTGQVLAPESGKFFIKEQYLVVRSPSPTWTSGGSFIGREAGRASSYLLDGTGTSGFNENPFPAAVSKKGSPIALEISAKGGYSLGTITDFMALKITVNGQDTQPTRYLLNGADGDLWLCKFDLAEILCYSRALTATEEASVGGYLAAKYGIKTAYPQPTNRQPVSLKTPQKANKP